MRNKFVQAARDSRLVRFLIGCVVLFVLVGVFGPFLFEYPRGFSPDVLQAPNLEHPFGTDSLGLGILEQTVWGTRTSLIVALGAGAITVGIGTVVGVFSAYSRWFDRVFGTLVDVLLSLPLFPLMIVVAALAGPNLVTLIVVLGVFSWPQLSRIIRAHTLVVLTEPYVDASRVLGASGWWILGRSVLPAAMPLVMLHGGLASARAVLGEASLSFLGLSDPGVWSWGRILHHAQRDGVLVYAWWQTLFPSLLILIFIGAVMMLGLQVTDRYDSLRTKLPAG